MKNKITYLVVILTLTITLNLKAQTDDFFYATMEETHALELKQKYPNEVSVIATNNNQAVVYLTKNAADELHHKILTHGPGYVFQANEALAKQLINKINHRESKTLDFTITEDDMVNQCINLVNPQNIEDLMLVLQDYGTRYHENASAKQAVLDMKSRWENLITATGRTDISVRLYEHNNTPMPSLILTFEGADTPSEFVIVGGHLDSTSLGNNEDSPGADDNASGVATINEIVRILLDVNYKPKKSVEFMLYAAEEVGLVGSYEIASKYANDEIDVVACLQLDMTNYKGSSFDVAITTDNYNSNQINTYLRDLMDHYNSSGVHQITYGNTICNYGCSDHYSWAINGYDTAFPFEAAFEDSNPNIHTSGDLYNVMGNTTHAAKFAKLGLEFVIESAKTATLSTEEINPNSVKVYVDNNHVLNYRFNNKMSIKSIEIIDGLGRKIRTEVSKNNYGKINVNTLKKGVYIIIFTTEKGEIYTEKFIIR